MASNSARVKGGGILVESFGEFAPVGLTNTIVARNTAPTGPDLLGEIGAAFSLIGDGTGAAIINTNGNQVGRVPPHTGPIDPLLGPLANNGGPTRTRALLAGSPAIDAASSDRCPGKDQRGVARPQGAACDIGTVTGTQLVGADSFNGAEDVLAVYEGPRSPTNSAKPWQRGLRPRRLEPPRVGAPVHLVNSAVTGNAAESDDDIMVNDNGERLGVAPSRTALWRRIRAGERRGDSGGKLRELRYLVGLTNTIVGAEHPRRPRTPTCSARSARPSA